MRHVAREEAMEVTVFVEQLDEQTYRAETAQPITLVTEGRTRDEAIERLRALAQQRLTAGEMVCLEIPEAAVPHPWVPFAGIWKDHPDIDAVSEHMAEERRRRDEGRPR
jgi:predicted RNase H-like HicB family nuclease